MPIQLKSLTVQAFRGIPDKRTFEFDSLGAIIHGPNGSGKSTILQAIEFLLTGQIGAFRGSGTGGVRITDHVPNRNADPDDTIVRAIFVDETGNSFCVHRRFTNRSELVAEERPAEFQALKQQAERGLLLLTREELLELVITTPANRKEQIYQLLDTSEIDERRKQLKRLARQADREAEKRQVRREEALNRIADVTAADVTVVRTTSDEDHTIDTDTLLTVVNRRRQQLGEPIAAIDDVNTFRDGIASPAEQASHPLQRADVQNSLEQLQAWLTNAPSYEERLHDFQEDLRALQADSAALASLSELTLVQQGQNLVDPSTTECPLCGTAWDQGDLANRLHQREERLARINDRSDALTTTAAELTRTLDQVTTPLTHLQNALAEADIEVSLTPLQQYIDHLEEVQAQLDCDLVGDIESIDPEQFEMTLAADDVQSTASALERTADGLAARSTLEEAWDELKVLSDAYQDWRAATKERAAYARAATELKTAKEEFIAARNDVLDDLYETMNERFADIYRSLNPDEQTFDPNLNQTNTGIEFRVDFHGDGNHPPNALHSEGHQDLMGVCLFLALAEELSPLDRTPILLDDVVMSVDSTHRERFATLLADELAEQFQFFISTHDEAWAEQLLNANVAHRSTSISFEEWSVTDGPIETR